MNARTSRLLRKHSLLVKGSVKDRQAKREWNQLPRNRRHKARLELQARINEYVAKALD